ncbi:CLUMA_CG011450, isoform A [Clunio marinus]|uniref:CLUMA_CG011450, isoform A n=1 Tax=Clunio marinus TaxID=568069 RepID=A0A1J1IE89_9DIPT|nr:CLUMA_CG011450, isoform A [Clunio marinus]
MKNESKESKKKKRENKPKPVKKPHFNIDESWNVIKIEHCFECPIFAVKSQEIFNILCENFPRNKIRLLCNESHIDGSRIEPRLGAFEISFAKSYRETFHLIWSGIEKGPPRREKFPSNVDDLVRQITKILVNI